MPKAPSFFVPISWVDQSELESTNRGRCIYVPHVWGWALTGYANIQRMIKCCMNTILTILLALAIEIVPPLKEKHRDSRSSSPYSKNNWERACGQSYLSVSEFLMEVNGGMLANWLLNYISLWRMALPELMSGMEHGSTLERFQFLAPRLWIACGIDDTVARGWKYWGSLHLRSSSTGHSMLAANTETSC